MNVAIIYNSAYPNDTVILTNGSAIACYTDYDNDNECIEIETDAQPEEVVARLTTIAEEEGYEIVVIGDDRFLLKADNKKDTSICVSDFRYNRSDVLMVKENLYVTSLKYNLAETRKLHKCTKEMLHTCGSRAYEIYGHFSELLSVLEKGTQ